MPYYPGIEQRGLAGRFLVDKQFLNNTLPALEDTSGIGLKARSGWATTVQQLRYKRPENSSFENIISA